MITSGEFNNYRESFNEPKSMQQAREKAFSLFTKSKLPSFKYGLNISIRPKSFDLKKLPLNKTPTPKVMIDIQNQKGINYFQGRNRGKEHEDRINEFLGDDWKTKEDDHQLYHFHHAFVNDFLCIHLEKDTELKHPIRITYDIEKGPVITNIFIKAEKGAKATILLEKKGDEVEYVGEEIRVIAEPQSKVDIVSFQNLSKETINIQRRKAKTQNEARVDIIDVMLGSSFTKNDVTSILKGQGSYGEIVGVFLASDQQRLDISTSSIHEGKATVSDIVTKGVITDEAKALSRGLVKINENASEANGYEQQDALLLSEKAEADAIPNLEINNNDVKCSHGSTIGQINKEQLFYLQTRGLTKKQAEKKIVEGYFSPIIAKFKNKVIQENVEKAIAKAL